MWVAEITVKQHLKEMQHAAEMHRMAVDVRRTQRGIHPLPSRWLTRLFAMLRRPQKTEVVEWTALPPTCQNVTTSMRRVS